MVRWLWLGIVLVGCGPGVMDDDDLADDDDVADDDDATVGAPLLLTFAWHLEGWNWDDPAVYDQYMNVFLPDTHALLDGHGAKATMEVHTDLARNAPVGAFDSYVAAGHEVAVHADLGGNPNQPYGMPQFVQDLTERKAELEGVAPGGAIRGVSGICSHLNWVAAARDAGFWLISGNVAWCTAAMANPPPEYANCQGAADCHDTYPWELADRLQPWRVATVDGWLADDPAGDLVLLPSSGTLPCFAETRGGDPGATGCTFDQDDIDAFIAELDDAVQLHQSEGGVHTLNLVWSFGQRPDATLFGAWLSAIDAYVADGRVSWATATQAAEAWLIEQ